MKSIFGFRINLSLILELVLLGLIFLAGSVTSASGVSHTGIIILTGVLLISYGNLYHQYYSELKAAKINLAVHEKRLTDTQRILIDLIEYVSLKQNNDEGQRNLDS